jgi:hypothetical protein
MLVLSNSLLQEVKHLHGFVNPIGDHPLVKRFQGRVEVGNNEKDAAVEIGKPSAAHRRGS